MHSDFPYFEIYGIHGEDDAAASLARIRPYLPGHGRLLDLGAQGSLMLVAREPMPELRWLYEDSALRVAVIGHLVHRSLAPQDMPGRLAQVHANGIDASFHDEFLGCYVLFFEDRQRGGWTLVGDYLGMQPLYAGTHGKSLVFGSRVLPLVQAELVDAAVDMDALAVWWVFGYALNDRTLFRAMHRLPVAGILQVGPSQWVEKSIFSCSDAQCQTRGALVEAMAAALRQNASTLAQAFPGLVCLLSGGYDSRMVLGLFYELGLRPSLYSVFDLEGEAIVAKQVADRLSLPLTGDRVQGDFADEFDPYLHFGTDGFPLGKSVPIVSVLRHHIHRPLANGHLGGSVLRSIRENLSAFQGGGAGETMQRAVSALGDMEALHLLTPAVAEDFRERAGREITNSLEGLVLDSRKPMCMWNLLNYHRRYLTNNALQYAEYADTLYPLYSKALLDIKISNVAHAFDKALQVNLLDYMFPTLQGIVHESELGAKFAKPPPASRKLRAASCGLIPRLPGFTGMDKLRSAKYLLSYAAGRFASTWAVSRILGLSLLNDQLHHLGQEISWPAKH